MGVFTDELWKNSKVCSIILIGERWFRRRWGGITDCRNGIFLINVLSEFRLLLFFSKLCQPAERFHIEFGKLLGQKIKSDLGYLDEHGDKQDFNMYLSPPSENSTSSFWNSFEALKLLMPSTLPFSHALLAC